MLKKISMAAVAVSISATSSMAATNITWWHGMGGRNGEVINEVSQKFNEAQKECALTPVSKGSYEEALASGIAAFRSGEQPNILQVLTLALPPSSTPRAPSFLPKTSSIRPATSSTATPSSTACVISTLPLTASLSACRSTPPLPSCMSTTKP